MSTELSTLILEGAASLGQGESLSPSTILQNAGDFEALDGVALADIAEEMNQLRLYGYVTGAPPRVSEQGRFIIRLTGITHKGREYLDVLRS